MDPALPVQRSCQREGPRPRPRAVAQGCTGTGETGPGSAVHFSGLGSARETHFIEDGRNHSVAIQPVWTSNSVDAALGAVVEGLGVGQLLSCMVDPLLRSGRWRPLLQADELPPVPITMVYPHFRLLSTTVRVFRDESATLLRLSLRDAVALGVPRVP